MEKKIYDLLNGVESNTDNYEKEEMTEFEVKKYMRDFREKNKMESNKKNASKFASKKWAAVASVGIITFGAIGTFGVVPSLATTNPVAYKIASMLGISKELASYETVVGQSVTKNDVTMKIENVIIDNDQVYVSVITSSNNSIAETFAGPGGRIYINGEEVNMGMTVRSNLIDEYTGQSLLTFPVNTDLDGKLDVKITLLNPLADNSTRSPHWDYEFSAEGSALKEETKSWELDNSYIGDNLDSIVLTKYTSNSVGDRIYFTTTGLEGKWMTVKGTDENGTEVEYIWEMLTAGEGHLIATMESKATVENAKTLTLSIHIDGVSVSDEFVINK